MHLTPTERDRLLLFSAAELARRRLADGVLLNVPEATAIVADTICEAARRGDRHDQAVAAGRAVLVADDVLPEVPYVVRTVSVEAVFADGSRLVVVSEPFGPVAERADMPGSVSVAPPVPEAVPETEADGRVTIDVVNTAPVTVSVTSHFHFFEANARLRFPRAAAYGMHLDIPAGTHVRFDPGSTTSVALAPIRGARVVVGFAGLVDGPLDEPGIRETALRRARSWGFLDSEAEGPDPDYAVEQAMAATREAATR
ncbi:urease subunit gamma [Nocardioides speluncae]|uniref:urease subunit gamma n=1 Tax=Nocardioides speluncae TaxID=2670337 RepID=UPI000D6971C7|nr:urease subunit gamma [Nocardioides speluncae]